jgi:hypothetical protein
VAPLTRPSGGPLQGAQPRHAGRAFLGLLGLAASAAMVLSQPAVAEPYEVDSFNARSTDDLGSDYTVAGGHDFENGVDIDFGLTVIPGGSSYADEPKNAAVTLIPGFFGNPAAATRCRLEKIVSKDPTKNDCPPGSQVGQARVQTPGGGGNAALYNIKPEFGYPAQFAWHTSIAEKFRFVLSVVPLPRTESYGLRVGSSNILRGQVQSFGSTFYGVPADHGVGISEAPFLSNPVDCSESAPTWKLIYDSWFEAGTSLPNGFPDFGNPFWKAASVTAPPVTGCEDPALTKQFDPKVAVTPLQGSGPVQADQPSGLAVDLDFPQSNDPTDLTTTFDPTIPQAPAPKDITVKLPAGLSISPSSASGLDGCSDLASDPAGDQVRYDDTKPVKCPDASKIGSVVATSPLLAAHDPVDDSVIGPEPIPGEVFLLKPHPGDLPVGGGNQDGKFRLLIQLEHRRYGINLKLPGVAIADKDTGQLTTVFTGNPQLPSKHLTVNLKTGPRAPLASPTTCGSFQTTSNFVPWSTPGTPNANPTASFNVGSGANGSACANSPGQRPFAPTMSAGTTSNAAGQSSPFVLHLSRKDGDQEFSGLEVTLPKGLAAKFIGLPYCSDAALSAAAAGSGKAEQSNPSCPASRIGSVTVGAGPGANPFYTEGNAYLAGPYKGAPMSVAVITPAVAGPFDLGTVVVRNALYVDPETAQARVLSDPFPKVIDGIPLKLRDITVNLDRPDFTLNPTNCEAKTITAKLTGSDGAVANPSNLFQASGCEKLGFKPDLKLSLKGGTKRGGYPALKATLDYPKGNYANIAKAVVNLPHSEFLAQNHIKTVCTRVQYAADQCPPGSIYGFVSATTPLLEKPLEGPLYLRSSSNPLPDLVAALHGQIDVDLVGRIDSKNGGLRTTFDAVPDAPVSKFVLTMQGGKKGLLENSRNLCKSVNRADVKFTAQNGLTANSRPALTNSCKKGKKAKKGKGQKGKAGGKSKGAKRLGQLGF